MILKLKFLIDKEIKKQDRIPFFLVDGELEYVRDLAQGDEHPRYRLHIEGVKKMPGSRPPGALGDFAQFATKTCANCSMTGEGNMKTKNLATYLFLGFVSLLTGCAGINKEVSIKPEPDAKWKYALENYSRDNMVEYDCNSFKIKVWEVFIRSKTYFTGPILPVIPVFAGLDNTKKDPYLKIEFGTTDGPELMYEDLSAITLTDEKNHIHASTGNNKLDVRPGAKFYRVGFDIPMDNITQFKLVFSKPLNNCLVSPVVFKKIDKTGFGYWTPGP